MTVGELQNIVTASADTGKTGGQFQGDPAVVKLVERYRSRMFSDRVPTNRPQPDPDMPNVQMKISLKDGAIPVKMRPFPMSHGEILILQQLLADLTIEKGYVELMNPLIRCRSGACTRDNFT